MRPGSWVRGWISSGANHQLASLRERRLRYTPIRPPVSPADRVVVVVNDGSAAGATMIAALKAFCRRGPRRLVAAIGAAPPDVVEDLQRFADEVVCLIISPDVFAVGQFYADFG